MLYFKQTSRNWLVTLFAFLVCVAVSYGLDDHGDNYEAATGLTIDGAAAVGFIDPATDDDWFSFEVQANHEYEITLNSTTSGFSDRYQIYGSDGGTLIPQSSSNRIITSETGPYYVKVYGNGSMGGYDLGVAHIGEVFDDHGNSRESATSISTDGSVIGGTITYMGDIDYFSFTANEQTIYSVEMRATSGRLRFGLENRFGSLIGRSSYSQSDWVGLTYYVGTGSAGEYYIQL